jgi:hypothetical protein
VTDGTGWFDSVEAEARWGPATKIAKTIGKVTGVTGSLRRGWQSPFRQLDRKEPVQPEANGWTCGPLENNATGEDK